MLAPRHAILKVWQLVSLPFHLKLLCSVLLECFPGLFIICVVNPQHSCTARVTVLGLRICVPTVSSQVYPKTVSHGARRKVRVLDCLVNQLEGHFAHECLQYTIHAGACAMGLALSVLSRNACLAPAIYMCYSFSCSFTTK
jgi:hypothetical protein